MQAPTQIVPFTHKVHTSTKSQPLTAVGLPLFCSNIEMTFPVCGGDNMAGC